MSPTAVPAALARLARLATLGGLLAALAGCSTLKPMLEQALPAVAAAAPAPPPPLVRVEVDAPEPLRQLLAQHLDLARLQTLREDELPDDTELARLMGAAPAQARALLQTEGRFDAQVTVQRDAAPPPGARVLVRVTVVPGPQTRVASLEVRSTPDDAFSRLLAAGDADARALDRTLRSDTKLAPGKPWRNPDWVDTKQQLLTRLRSAGFAAARIGDSLADVDADAASAALSVSLASGPLFRAGPLQIEGLKAHDAETVRNLAGFGAGAPLTESRLLDYQERLQKAGLFERASVGFEPDPAEADAAPVLVSVSEAPLQQATVGVGISGNTGPRTSLEHTHRRPFGQPWVAYNKLEWGRDSQSWTGDFTSHPLQGFVRHLVGVQIERVKSDTDVVLSQRLRVGRTQDTPRIERLQFAEYLRSRQSDALSVSTASALSANMHWVWRDLDSALLPTKGVALSLQTALGQATSGGGADGPFGRVYGRLTAYRPLGARWHAQARLEAGQVVKQAVVAVPDALGFRAGGDESVRGYAYRSLAPTAADGTVRSGLMLATGSLELARPVSDALPSVWGAVFVDAGRAVDHWGDFRPAWGWGAGVRWRSPIGPLRADLAWGDELRKLRLHLSVGIAF